uniref:Uncharacterized protein n=1 Tax=Oryza barthii TaxID=65489 RepID=A0A0D3F0E5_9ORYZ
MAPGRFVTSGMEVFSKLVMMPIARHSQRRRRVMSAASEILTENCRLLRRRISGRSELGCGLPPCRHRGNTPSAAGLSPPRCCCDSTEEFAAGRGFIRPRLGLGNLLVDIEREGSYRHADEGPSPPRRCDLTEFRGVASSVVASGSAIATLTRGRLHLAAAISRNSASRRARRPLHQERRRGAVSTSLARCRNSTELVAARIRFIRRCLGNLLVESDGDGTNFPRRHAGIHDAHKLGVFLEGFSGKLDELTMEMAAGSMKPPDEIISCVRLPGSSPPLRDRENLKACIL